MKLFTKLFSIFYISLTEASRLITLQLTATHSDQYLEFFHWTSQSEHFILN